MENQSHEPRAGLGPGQEYRAWDGASVPRSFPAYFLPLQNFNLSKRMTQPTMQETKTPGKTKMPALQVCEMERLSKLVGPMSAS